RRTAEDVMGIARWLALALVSLLGPLVGVALAREGGLTDEERQEIDRKVRRLLAEGKKLADGGRPDLAAGRCAAALEWDRGLWSRAEHPQGHPRLAVLYLLLGETRAQSGRPDLAVAPLQSGLAMLRQLYPERHFPDGHPLVASGHFTVGNAFA